MENILIVDDNEQNLRLLQRGLEAHNFGTTLAHSGRRALEILKNNSIKCIISDVLMPEMDGFQLCRQIKENEKYKDIPFIFLTSAYGDKKDYEFGLSLGADNYLLRPISFADLTNAIGKSIAKRKSNGSYCGNEDDELNFLKQYSERVVKKLEYEVDELKHTNLRMERMIRELSFLNRVGQLLNSTVDTQQIFKLVIDKSVEIMEATTGSIMLLDEKGYLTIRYAVGLSDNVVKKTRVKLGDGVSGKVVETGEPMLAGEPEFRFPLLYDRKYNSFISVPILIKGKASGVISITDKKEGKEFTKEDLALLTTLASETAISLENAQLLKDTQEVLFSSIEALASAIDAKDPYTHGHSRRVTQYALKIGNFLNLDDEQLEVLRTAGLLHDVGKIGIREDIIAKPSGLTEEEYEQIKNHPSVGANILKPVKKLKEAAKGVIDHHERYDGTGYPRGLAGKKISLSGRILAVADAFDAMTSDRPYRKALDRKQAINELNACSGTQFDSEVVNAFLKVISV